MDALTFATGASVPLESVLCTEELKRRPSRPPDYQAENQALLALAQELTNSPGSVQRLVDVALELCRGHSAGISLLEEDGPPGGLNPREIISAGSPVSGRHGLEHHHAARQWSLRHSDRSQHHVAVLQCPSVLLAVRRRPSVTCRRIASALPRRQPSCRHCLGDRAR